MRIEAAIARRPGLALRRHGIAKLEADLAQPEMRLGVLRIGPHGIAQIDLRRPKVALLQRLTGIGKVIGAHRRRQNAEPDGQQKPAELLHTHAM